MTYASQSVTGYNATPPDDDGSETTENQVKWSTIKTKLGDPLKTAIENVNTEMVAHAATRFGNSVETFSTTITFDGNDEGTIQKFTGASATTATLPSAATVGAGFVIGVRNGGTAVLTLDGNSSETISGSLTFALQIGQGVVLVSDGTNFEIAASSAPQGGFLSTGFAMPFLGSTAPAGWVALDRSSIGDASTGADDESAENEALFNHLHAEYSDTECPVLEASAGWQTVESVAFGADTITITGHGLLSNAKVVLIDGGGATAPGGLLFNRVYYVVTATSDTFKLSATDGPGSAVNITSNGSGTMKIAEVSKGTAASDWSAGKILILEDWRGRAPFGYGTGEDGSGGTLTARGLGDRGGAETHTLTAAQMPSHSHVMFHSESDFSATTALGSNSDVVSERGGAAADERYQLRRQSSAYSADTQDRGVTKTAGSGSAHNNMPPFVIANWCVKK